MRCFVVLPCFNEEKNIKPLVYSIDEALRSAISYKIIAVNDGSRDRTAEMLKDLSADYPVEVLEHSVNLGLGAALKTGLEEVAEESLDEDFVVVMDSDNTHDPRVVLDMLSAAEKADVVVGSRYVRGGSQLNVPLHRVILSRAINLVLAQFFRLSVKDATSGFRCFRARLVRRLCRSFRGGLIESEGFVASLELLLKAVRSGGVVSEVPISLDYGRKKGASKMHLPSTIVSYVLLILKMCV